MPVQLVIQPEPSKEDIKVIYNGLFAYNTEAYGTPEQRPFVVLLRDDDGGETVGGLHSIYAYGWLYISMLFIPGSLRNQGYGTKLLREAETFAREQNCKGVWVDTFSFQAPGFYEKAGYEPFGELTDFPPGHRRIFYRKMLR
ncbi:MAG: GNAT family N-acetyltransferase [Bacteroidetes bacterium]|nr:GNAT family N-acetyltransferase [Bacteroidota bacterium]